MASVSNLLQVSTLRVEIIRKFKKEENPRSYKMLLKQQLLQWLLFKIYYIWVQLLAENNNNKNKHNFAPNRNCYSRTNIKEISLWAQ